MSQKHLEYICQQAHLIMEERNLSPEDAFVVAIQEDTDRAIEFIGTMQRSAYVDFKGNGRDDLNISIISELSSNIHIIINKRHQNPKP